MIKLAKNYGYTGETIEELCMHIYTKSNISSL
jgi:hypothetical protein